MLLKPQAQQDSKVLKGVKEIKELGVGQAARFWILNSRFWILDSDFLFLISDF